MTVRKPAVPQAPKGDRFASALKETLEIYKGARGTPIVHLSTSATDAEIIAKINEILDLLQ